LSFDRREKSAVEAKERALDPQADLSLRFASFEMTKKKESDDKRERG
jgi:hypothetical protein